MTKIKEYNAEDEDELLDLVMNDNDFKGGEMVYPYPNDSRIIIRRFALLGICLSIIGLLLFVFVLKRSLIAIPFLMALVFSTYTYFKY